MKRYLKGMHITWFSGCKVYSDLFKSGKEVVLLSALKEIDPRIASVTFDGERPKDDVVASTFDFDEFSAHLESGVEMR